MLFQNIKNAKHEKQLNDMKIIMNIMKNYIQYNYDFINFHIIM